MTAELGARHARREAGRVLLIDVASEIGSRPTGWWRDRAADGEVVVRSWLLDRFVE